MVDVPAVAVELIELLAVVVGAGATSAIGVVLERLLTAVTAGDLALGAWAVGMGLLALYVGVVALGYEQALPGSSVSPPAASERIRHGCRRRIAFINLHPPPFL